MFPTSYIFVSVICSVQFSLSVMPVCLWPHGLHEACQASLSKNSSWSLPKLMSVELVMSSSHLILCCPLLLLLQSFPASGSFQMSQLFASGGQSIGVSASASVLPINIQDWFPLIWTGFISLNSRDCQESSPIPQFKSIISSVFSFL